MVSRSCGVGDARITLGPYRQSRASAFHGRKQPVDLKNQKFATFLGMVSWGLHIYRDTFKDYDELRNLQETDDLLARAEDWPYLYDEQQLAKNGVSIYSAMYNEDIYMHFDLSETCTIPEQFNPNSGRFSRFRTSARSKRLFITPSSFLLLELWSSRGDTDFEILIGRSIEN